MSSRLNLELNRVEPTAEDVSYAAGLFDGEGTVALYVNGNHYACNTSVSLTATTPLKKLWQWFGGGVYDVTKPTSHRSIWRWLVSGPEAATFCATVMDKLLIKREQAQLVILYYETVSGEDMGKYKLSGLPADIVKLRSNIAARCKILKTVNE